MPNKTYGCADKLEVFFKQWWDTAYVGSPAAGNKPSITGPGLAGGASMTPTAAARTTASTRRPRRRHRAGDAEPDARHAGHVRLLHPGAGEDVHVSTTANVISTAGDSALSVADPSATATATWSTARSRCRRR